LASIDRPFRAIAPSYGVDLRALARHATRNRRDRLRRSLMHTVLLLIGIVALAIVILGGTASVLPVAVVGAVLALGWSTEFADLWTARREALTLIEDGTDPASVVPPADPDVEGRLAQLGGMNVVVYGSNRHFPFVGSGWWVGRWSIPPVDVTRAALDERGQKRKVVPFNAVRLHDHLATAVRIRGPEGVQVSNRLYVRGTAAEHIEGLLGGKPQAPEPIVDPDVVKSALLDPQSAIQTYLCLEKITFGGQLVVSMFAHAVLEQNLLTVGVDCFFLPPLRRSYWLVTELPREPLRVLARTIADAAGAFPHDLLAAPGQIVRFWMRRLGRRRRAARLARRIRRGRGFDYGAATGIREEVADIAEANHVDLASEERYLQMLQRQVIDAIIEFLDRHNVDTSDLRKRQGDIVSHTTYNFQGNVGGWGHYFGDRGNQVNTPPGRPPGGQAAGWQP
jgi:hypothetical protein